MNRPLPPKPQSGEVRTIRDSRGRIVAEVDTRTADVRTIRRGEVVEFNAKTGEVKKT